MTKYMLFYKKNLKHGNFFPVFVCSGGIMLYYSIATKLLVKPILIHKNMNCILNEKSIYIVQPIVNIVF
jgi:hypothetical protein